MLNSVGSVIDALGGTAAVAALTGVGKSAVSNWRSRGAIPAENFLTMTQELAKRDLAADPTVFGLKQPLDEARV